MKVIHKNADKGNGYTSMTLSHWHKHYYPNKKYMNYKFYDVPEIYDLYEIDETTGNITYLRSDFASQIFPKVRKNPKKFVYKEHDTKYLDEYLMPRKIDYSGLPFLKRLSKRIEQIIKPKKNPNKIPFSRSESIQIKIGIWSIIVAIALFVIEKLFF